VNDEERSTLEYTLSGWLGWRLVLDRSCRSAGTTTEWQLTADRLSVVRGVEILYLSIRIFFVFFFREIADSVAYRSMY
jgi:hypothetical protein